MNDATTTDTATDAIDPSRCPLCGGGNRCVMACEEAPPAQGGRCWCVGVRFTPELLAQVPPPLRSRACICPACAGAAQATGTA